MWTTQNSKKFNGKKQYWVRYRSQNLEFIFKRSAKQDSLLFLEFLLNEALVRC